MGGGQSAYIRARHDSTEQRQQQRLQQVIASPAGEQELDSAPPALVVPSEKISLPPPLVYCVYTRAFECAVYSPLFAGAAASFERRAVLHDRGADEEPRQFRPLVLRFPRHVHADDALQPHSRHKGQGQPFKYVGPPKEVS